MLMPMILLLAELSFSQSIVIALINYDVPTAILVIRSSYLLNLYEIAKKKSEQEVELARFIRERQYLALAELYAFFAEFMRLYRVINSADTKLDDDTTRVTLLKE